MPHAAAAAEPAPPKAGLKSAEPKPAKRSRAAPRKHQPAPGRLSKVAGLVLDCDGVLTDGGLFYDTAGARLLRFDAKDGFGLALLCRTGMPVGVLSGRPTPIAERRLKELGVKHFLGQSGDKGDGLVAICASMGISVKDCAFVGDDIPDLAAFERAGLKVAVADAAPEVLAAADWITTAAGGRGAVREICTALLEGRGVWQRVLDRVRGSPGPRATAGRAKPEESKTDKPRIVKGAAGKPGPTRA